MIHDPLEGPGGRTFGGALQTGLLDVDGEDGELRRGKVAWKKRGSSLEQIGPLVWRQNAIIKSFVMVLLSQLFHHSE